MQYESLEYEPLKTANHSERLTTFSRILKQLLSADFLMVMLLMINREGFLCHKIQKTQNMKRGYWFFYLWESSIIKKEK